jgi:RNA polymerase sigma-70 factor (ECF subfamily)
MGMENPIEAVEPTDAALLRRYAVDGNVEAIDLLIERYRDYAYRLALQACGGRHADAEDIVQQAFMTVMRLAGQYSSDEPARYWIGKIALNQCKVHYRSRTRRTRVEHEKGQLTEKETISAKTDEETEAMKDVVREIVGTLPEKHRMLLTLRYYEGLSIAEVAKMLDLRERTVYNLLSKSVQHLRKRMATKGFTLSGAAIAGVLEQLADGYAALKAPSALAVKLNGLKLSALAAQSLKVGTAGYVAWTAAAVLVVVATLGGVVYVSNQGAGEKLLTSAAAEPAVEWSFAHGPVKDLIPISGEWVWWPADKSSASCMAATPATFTVVPLPVKIPAQPMLVELTVRWIIQDGVPSGIQVVWLNENQIPPSRFFVITPKSYSGESVVLQTFVLDKRIVIVRNNKITNFTEYAASHPSDRLALFLMNATVEKITLRPVTEKEIPAIAREATMEKLAVGKTPPPLAPRNISEAPHPLPPLNKSWSFADGPNAEFEVVKGEPWQWSAATDLRPGCMNFPETKQEPIVNVPVQVSIRPFRVTMHLRANSTKQKQMGYSVGWSPFPSPEKGFVQEKTWLRRNAPPSSWKVGEPVKVTAYFNRRYMVTYLKGSFTEEQIALIQRFPRPFFSPKVFISGYGYSMEQLDLRELTHEELPDAVRNPEEYLEKTKADWREVERSDQRVIKE